MLFLEQFIHGWLISQSEIARIHRKKENVCSEEPPAKLFRLHQASVGMPTPAADAPDVISQLHPAHGKAKTYMAGSLPFLDYTLSH